MPESPVPSRQSTESTEQSATSDGKNTSAHPRYRIPWRHRIIIGFAVLCLFIAVYSSFANGKWQIIDNDSRFLLVQFAVGGSHVAYISMPGKPELLFPDATTESTREYVEQKVAKSRVMWDLWFASTRIGFIGRCQWLRTMNIRAGRADYWKELSDGGEILLEESLRWESPYAVAFGVPGWWWSVPGVLLLIPPLVARWQYGRRMRWMRHCRSCGYDLTGNQSGVCPECGAVVTIDPPNASHD